MALRIQCSGCQTICQVPDDSRGKKVRCPKCGIVIMVPALTAPPTAATPPAPRPAAAANPAPPTPASAVTNLPSFSAPKALAPQEDDFSSMWSGPGERVPVPSVRRGFKLSAANKPWILVAAGGGGLLLLGILVALFSGGSKRAPEPLAKVTPPPVNVPVPESVPAKGEEKPAPPPVKQAEVPPGPTPNNIDVTTTRKVKKATAYLKVTMGNGQVAEGSGFFAVEPGLVFTNAHVLGMLSSASGMPKKVDVVVHSGEPGEFTRAANVLGVDRTSDLGIIRVDGSTSDLPEPLPVDTTEHLTELQEVYVFGFPFGSSLGKNITVSKSSVSSLRKHSDGSVHQIQVNGGMNPGNSGGPVVDARGVVVGVAVSIIRGTGINFAVPGEKVLTLLRGRVADVQFGEPYIESAQARLPIHIACLDPLTRLRNLKIEVWSGDPGPARPIAQKKPEPLPGDGPKQTLPVAYKDGKASIEVSVPLKDSKVFWVQPVLTDGNGSTYWGATHAYVASEYPPLERKPAKLKQQFASAAERTVKWGSSHQLVMSSGSNQMILGESLDVEAVELLRTDPKGASFNLFLVNSKLSIQANGENTPQNLKALGMLRGRYFTFITDPTGFLLQRSNPTLGAPNPFNLQRDFAEMVSRIANSYEMTCLSIPSREVAPKDNWPARLPMILASNGRAEVVDMMLTCTYEGTRSVKGRPQALIELAGNLRRRQPGGQNIGGKVVGKAHFATDEGYISEAKVKVETEVGGNNSNATHVFEVTLTREPGNTLGVVPTPIPPPAPILVKGKVLLNEQGTLGPAELANHPERPGIPYKLYSPTLVKGTTYIIELNKTNNNSSLDPYLVMHNPKGQKVAEDDDSGGDLNSRIVYRANQTGVHQIYATTLMTGQTGAFRLIVAEAVSPKAAAAK